MLVQTNRTTWDTWLVARWRRCLRRARSIDQSSGTERAEYAGVVGTVTGGVVAPQLESVARADSDGVGDSRLLEDASVDRNSCARSPLTIEHTSPGEQGGGIAKSAFTLGKTEKRGSVDVIDSRGLNGVALRDQATGITGQVGNSAGRIGIAN